MPQKTGDDLSCTGMVRSLWSTSVTLVTNPEATKSLATTS